MKLKITTFCATLMLAASTWMQAAEPGKAKTGSTEFERMKSLVGIWSGKCDMGQGPVDMTIQYRVIAGGSVVEERSSVGTPEEMVTMFYDKAGKLAMTHYCVLGNRPEMALKAADAKSLTFDLDPSCCTIDTKKESHMRSVKIQFEDPETISLSCKAVMDGKEMPEHSTVLKRVHADAITSK
jgi:hypothetical protein